MRYGGLFMASGGNTSSNPWGLVDALPFGEVLWPNVKFYKEQEDIIRSVDTNVETLVVAANQMGI